MYFFRGKYMNGKNKYKNHIRMVNKDKKVRDSLIVTDQFDLEFMTHSTFRLLN